MAAAPDPGRRPDDDACPMCWLDRLELVPWTAAHMHAEHPRVVAACRRSRRRELSLRDLDGVDERPSPGRLPDAGGGQRRYASASGVE